LKLINYTNIKVYTLAHYRLDTLAPGNPLNHPNSAFCNKNINSNFVMYILQNVSSAGFISIFFGNLFINKFLLLCRYQNVLAANVLPTLSIADVKMQETHRTEDSDSCQEPHDYYER